MSRDMTSAMQSALAAPVVKPAIIVRLDFATGAVRVHSGVGNLSFNSETYTGLGALGAVADIVETIDGSSNTCDLQMVASSALIALALGEIGGARGRQGRVWFGSYDLSTGLLISDPIMRYSGVIGTISHDDNGETGKLVIGLVDETGDQERPRTRYYNMADQQRIDSTDTSMKGVVDLPNKQLNWGNSKVFTGNPRSDGGGGGDSTSDQL